MQCPVPWLRLASLRSVRCRNCLVHLRRWGTIPGPVISDEIYAKTICDFPIGTQIDLSPVLHGFEGVTIIANQG